MGDLDNIFGNWKALADGSFDKIFSDFDHIFGNVANGTYPPHNVEEDVNGNVVITVALAGLKREDVQVYDEDGILHIKYEKPSTSTDMTETDAVEAESKLPVVAKRMLHRGIARRSFHLRFKLNSYKPVSGSMEDGLLSVKLEKVDPKVNRNEIEIS